MVECKKCKEKKKVLESIHVGKRPEHIEDFTSSQIEHVDKLRKDIGMCKCRIGEGNGKAVD